MEEVNIIVNFQVVHTCNPSTGEAEAGRSEVQSHLQLHREFERNQGRMSLYLKKYSEPVHFKLGRSHGGGRLSARMMDMKANFPDAMI